MHKLSVIIVNYKTPILTSQAIDSACKASKDMDVDIWLVDNNSQDGSVEYLKSRYPNINIVPLSDNLGYAKGNNVAIRQVDSQYVLLLNPDTIISENTLRDCLDFMDKNENAGAVGIKMHDISGKYLQESKRGFPSLWVSFTKLIGLFRFFPHSKLFSFYYMGHLSENDICKVQVLSGAFMMLRKSVLDNIGLLDERFFMYGEDIDLSYRVMKSGYDCCYLPIPMIHYKGESSVQNTKRYIDSFYGAMILFYNKYHPKFHECFKRFFVKLSVGFIKRLAILKSKMKRSTSACKQTKQLVEFDILSSELPAYGSNIIIDKSKYSYGQIIEFICSVSKNNYTIHFCDFDKKTIISPKIK